MEEAIDIRENIRAYIKNKGFVQATIAKNAGITDKTLSLIMNKKRKLETGEFFNICDALGVSMEQIKDYNESA